MVEYNPQALDITFHALAHPVRREILRQLAGNELTVLQISDHFDISLNGVSKHLKVLEQAGLVRRNIQGRTHSISLNIQPLQEVETWIESYRTFWEQRLDVLGEYLENRKKATNS